MKKYIVQINSNTIGIVANFSDSWRDVFFLNYQEQQVNFHGSHGGSNTKSSAMIPEVEFWIEMVTV